jgi:CBS domain-containing protein
VSASETVKVSDWMSRRVVSVAPDDPLARALELMAEHGIRHVLVRRDDELLGIVSNRDVIRATGQTGKQNLLIHQTPVEKVMTPGPLESTWPGASMREAAGRMREARVSALPVLEGAELVGVITTDDLLAAVAEGHL